MDRLGSRTLRRIEHRRLVEVALGRRASADQVRLVGVGDVRRVAVGLGVDGDRPDPELPEGAEDPDRDLAPVGDEHLSEDGHAVFCPWH